MIVVPYDVPRPYELETKALSCLWEVRLPVELLVMGRRRFDELGQVVASLPAAVEREGRLLYAAA
jgi:hypothetical protein